MTTESPQERVAHLPRRIRKPDQALSSSGPGIYQLSWGYRGIDDTFAGWLRGIREGPIPRVTRSGKAFDAQSKALPSQIKQVQTKYSLLYRFCQATLLLATVSISNPKLRRYLGKIIPSPDGNQFRH